PVSTPSNPQFLLGHFSPVRFTLRLNKKDQDARRTHLRVTEVVVSLDFHIVKYVPVRHRRSKGTLGLNVEIEARLDVLVVSPLDFKNCDVDAVIKRPERAVQATA